MSTADDDAAAGALRPESLTDSSDSEPALRPESLSDSGDTEPARAASGPTGDRPETEWERRRRIAAAFGDVLPAQTSDDAGPSVGTGEGKGDAWYREQVPPHHG